MRKLGDEAPLRSHEDEGRSNVLSQTWSCLINSDKVERALSSQSVTTSKLTLTVRDKPLFTRGAAKMAFLSLGAVRKKYRTLK